eukprot:4011310-Amphidinium_carterae.1
MMQGCDQTMKTLWTESDKGPLVRRHYYVGSAQLWGLRLELSAPSPLAGAHLDEQSHSLRQPGSIDVSSRWLLAQVLQLCGGI